MEKQVETLHEKIDRYTKYKNYNLILSASYKRLKKKRRYYRVLDCGTFLEFKKYENGQVLLSGANFCKDRLCPQCAKRRSLKILGQLSKVINELNINNCYEYLFCTLTLRNCRKQELDYTLDSLSKAFTKFTKSRFFRRSAPFKGCFRSTEITINKDNGTFHPHLHLLIAVNKNYFISKDYIKTVDIVDTWRRCLAIDYNPICYVKKVKNLENVKFEVAKYITKGSDFLISDDIGKTDELVELLSDVLYNKRFISYTGCFFQARKKLKLQDKDIDENINIDEIESCNELAYIIKKFRWNFGFSRYEEF